MSIITVVAINIGQAGCDGACKCGENWGFMGHSHFNASYRCPTCNEIHALTQCAAWPISSVECEVCGDNLECSLTPVKGVNFR